MQIYDSISSSFMDLICIIVCCGIGSVTKDLYDTITGKESKVKIARIFLSTVVSCYLMFCLEDIMLKYIADKIFLLVCFISGLVGFELAGKLSNLDVVLKIFSKITFKK